MLRLICLHRLKKIHQRHGNHVWNVQGNELNHLAQAVRCARSKLNSKFLYFTTKIVRKFFCCSVMRQHLNEFFPTPRPDIIPLRGCRVFSTWFCHWLASKQDAKFTMNEKKVMLCDSCTCRCFVWRWKIFQFGWNSLSHVKKWVYVESAFPMDWKPEWW